MRRVVLTLTTAQATWLRGAVRSHLEDMSIAGMLSADDERRADHILHQLSKPAKETRDV
jgi:hypothetical protein